MKLFLTLLLAYICNITIATAQQRIDITKGESANCADEFPSKEVNGELYTAALVVVQSNVELKYSIAQIPIDEGDIRRSIDNNNIYVDSIRIYVSPKDSQRRIALFAPDYPSEVISANILPRKIYNYMVISPISVEEETIEEVETYEKLLSQGRAAIDGGMFEYAETILERAAAKSQTDDVYALLAFAQYKQAGSNYTMRVKIHNKAIDSATKSLELNPSNFLANVAMGATLFDQATYKHKLTSLGSVSMSDQRKQKQAKYELIIKYMETAIDLSKNADYPSEVWDVNIYYIIGGSYFTIKDNATAYEYMKKATGENQYKAEWMLQKIEHQLKEKVSSNL